MNVYSTLWPIVNRECLLHLMAQVVNHECLLDPPYAVGTVENVLSAHHPPPIHTKFLHMPQEDKLTQCAASIWRRSLVTTIALN